MPHKKLIEGNKRFSMTKKFEDPEYFKKLSLGQKPSYLWVGCSDSRVPANEITGTESGEIFVHRNIANLVIHTDFNLMSVLDYAVNVLGVLQVIVCGHYGCGGVRAAMGNQSFGIVDNWLLSIKDVYLKHQIDLENISDLDKRADRLTELNVIEQVKNLSKTKIIQSAWSVGKQIKIHGWVYGLNSGLITQLSTLHDGMDDVDPIYRHEFE
jgi:carbonic anhydrase